MLYTEEGMSYVINKREFCIWTSVSHFANRYKQLAPKILIGSPSLDFYIVTLQMSNLKI